MSYLDKYKKRNKMYGDGVREIRINNSKRIIESRFKDSPSYYRIMVNSPQFQIDEFVEIDAQIVDSTDIRDEKKLSAYYESNISTGCLFKWQEKYWLMIHQDDMSEIYKRGVIRRCYTTLKWQGTDGEIKEAWFTNKTDVSPNFGIDERDKSITMPDERRQVLVQSNKDTRQFKKMQRFIFDGRAWEIITLDTTADGIINMVLDESELNPALDDMDLRIADYKPITYKVSILDENNISVSLNQPIQLNIVAFKNNTQVSIDEINISSSNELVGIVDNKGFFTPKGIGQVTIAAEYMGQIARVDINVSNIQYNNYVVEINGSDTIDFGQSETYSIVFKNNGLVIDEDMNYYLYAEDGLSTTALATVKNVSGNQITIIANNKSKLGFIQLHIESKNQLMSRMKKIRIKGFM